MTDQRQPKLGQQQPRSRTQPWPSRLQPSKELAAVVGSAPLPRTEVVSKVWEYIKANNLQNPANKREIVADEKLKAVLRAGTRSRCSR